VVVVSKGQRFCGSTPALKRYVYPPAFVASGRRNANRLARDRRWATRSRALPITRMFDVWTIYRSVSVPWLPATVRASASSRWLPSGIDPSSEIVADAIPLLTSQLVASGCQFSTLDVCLDRPG
jgi:hypothetical protein